MGSTNLFSIKIELLMKLRHILFLAALTCERLQWHRRRLSANRVGVNVSTPTERLHVNGTARIQTLPKDGQGVTTSAAGAYDDTKAQPLQGQARDCGRCTRCIRFYARCMAAVLLLPRLCYAHRCGCT